MNFLGGFVGVSQDPDTKALKPEIGWLVGEQEKEEEDPTVPIKNIADI